MSADPECVACFKPLTAREASQGVLCDACELEEHGGELDDDDGEPRCSNPGGHEFECTGTQYGGDDERWGGEGRSLCIHCGADGDA